MPDVKMVNLTTQHQGPSWGSFPVAVTTTEGKYYPEDVRKLVRENLEGLRIGEGVNTILATWDAREFLLVEVEREVLPLRVNQIAGAKLSKQREAPATDSSIF